MKKKILSYLVFILIIISFTFLGLSKGFLITDDSQGKVSTLNIEGFTDEEYNRINFKNDTTINSTVFDLHIQKTVSNSSFLMLSSTEVFPQEGLGGSIDEPLIINNAQDMKKFSDMVNIENNNFANQYIKVGDEVTEIDLTSVGFYPIGYNGKTFNGHFDGNGAEFKIGLNFPSTTYSALFGYVSNATIKNLTVSGYSIGGNNSAGIVGYSTGNSYFENLHNKASVNGSTYVGGIVGRLANSNNYIAITNSYNSGEITGTSQVGGLVGRLQVGIAQNLYNSGTIIGGTYTGGVVGYQLSGNLNFSYNSGFVYGSSSIGGVIGYRSSGSYSHSFNDVYKLEAAPNISGKNKATSIGGNINSSGTFLDLNHGEMIDVNALYNNFSSFSVTDWEFKDNNGTVGYYPQLKVFSEGSLTQKNDSLQSVTTSLFIGNGTLDTPYQIRTSQDMRYLSEFVDAGNNTIGLNFAVPTVTPTISLNDNFSTIGSAAKPFKGNFDGNGTNFILNLNGTNYQGLFGYVTNGVIKNLSVSGSVTGNDYVGGVAGYSDATITDVYVDAVITGSNNVGGILGYNGNNGNLNYAFNSNIVIGNNYVGGAIGTNNGSVIEVLNYGSVFASSNVGGVIGHELAGTSQR
ncbi:MAG: hypothetical protein WDA47_00945, partial [Bacilli bacterium]